MNSVRRKTGALADQIIDPAAESQCNAPK